MIKAIILSCFCVFTIIAGDVPQKTIAMPDRKYLSNNLGRYATIKVLELSGRQIDPEILYKTILSEVIDFRI